MHSAIIYVILPAHPSEAQRVYATFEAMIQKSTANREAVRRLDQLVWQVDFQEAPGALAAIVHAAEQLGLQYGILPLAEEPKWIVKGRARPEDLT